MGFLDAASAAPDLRTSEQKPADATRAVEAVESREQGDGPAASDTASLKMDVSAFTRDHDGSKFPISGDLDERTLYDLLVWTADKGASDVTIETGFPVKADFSGTWCAITDRVMTDRDLRRAIGYAYGGEHGIGKLEAGDDLDPPLETFVRKDGRRRYRVNITACRVPGGRGYQMTFRTLPSVPPTLVELGIEKEIVDNTRPGAGMIVVCGPTGSGKSTLLAATIRHLIERGASEKILEYSSPIEYVYDGLAGESTIVTQTEVGQHLRPPRYMEDMSPFAYAVRNALRRKPSIILIGEARDRETIEGCIEASLTGHLLYTTLHSTGVGECLPRMVKPFPGGMREQAAADIMTSMRMVVSQKLLPGAEGGRVACREFMVFDQRIRNKYMDTHIDDWPSLTRKTLQDSSTTGRTFVESAYLLLEAGKISPQTYKTIASAQRGAA